MRKILALALALFCAQQVSAQQVYNYFKPPGMGCPVTDAQTGTTYTLVLSDQCVTMNNVAANTVTIPTNASVAFAVGTVIYIQQIGAGLTTISPAGGVTINNVAGNGGGSIILGNFGLIALRQTATNIWNADLTPAPTLQGIQAADGTSTTLMNGGHLQTTFTSSQTTTTFQFVNNSASTVASQSISNGNDNGDDSTVYITGNSFSGTFFPGGPSGQVGGFGCNGAADSIPCVWFNGDLTNDAIWFTDSSLHNEVHGLQLAGSTSATNGFFYLPSVGGTPTGTPAHTTGTGYATAVPLEYDTTHNKLFAYNSGWKNTADFPSNPLATVSTAQFTVASGTATCATTSTLHGGVQAGDLKCTTAGTAASTVTLTLAAATTAYSCEGRDVTTPTTVTQTGVVSTTAVTLTLTSVTQNDVVQFHCIEY